MKIYFEAGNANFSMETKGLYFEPIHQIISGNNDASAGFDCGEIENIDLYNMRMTMNSGEEIEIDSIEADENDIVEVEGNDGDIWEVTFWWTTPCEVRRKGADKWEEATWNIFCEKYGVELDALA